jgi:NitT/TauT family transport system permease protein
LIEAAQTLGANNWNILTQIVLPSALPYIVSGLKVGVSIALMCTVSAEMIASSRGLGYMILTASQLFQPGTVVVGMIIIGLIGILFDYGFRKAQDRIFW